MLNIYQSQPVKIVKIKKQSPIVKLFTLQFLDKNQSEGFYWLPGQFIEASIPGFGEGPFAICSANQDKKFFEICARNVGQLTDKMHQLKKGDQILVRGPYGNGFPDIGKSETLLVAGGIGIIPLRALILTQIKKGLADKLRIFYGAKMPRDFLFLNEFKKWQAAGVKLNLTIDKTCPGWDGCVGVVTVFFDTVLSKLSPAEKPRAAVLCGPPIMCKFVLEKLKEYGFEDKNIYLSLERRMHCGVGICQHCAIGPKYVCKDGPVFRWQDIKDIENAI